MISTDEAKVIAVEIKVAVESLNRIVVNAAERGVNAEFQVRTNRLLDYPAEYIELDRISVDLEWMSPEETEAFLASLPDDED